MLKNNYCIELTKLVNNLGQLDNAYIDTVTKNVSQYEYCLHTATLDRKRGLAIQNTYSKCFRVAGTSTTQSAWATKLRSVVVVIEDNASGYNWLKYQSCPVGL